MDTEVVNDTLSMSALIDGISGGLCVCSSSELYPHIRFNVWNKGMIDITGYTLEEVNRNDILQTLFLNFKPDMKKLQWIEAKSKNCTMDEEIEIRRKDGEIRYLSINTSIVKSDKGVPHILSLVRDITKEKQINTEFKELNEGFNTLFEVSPDAVFVHDGDRIILANASAVELLGAKDISELTEHNILKFIHADYHELIEKCLVETKGSAKIIPPVKEQFIKLDGEIIDVEVSWTPFCFRNNNYSLVSVRNITERIRTETELRKSRKKFRDLFNNISDSIFIYKFTEEGRKSFFIEANNEACKRLGYTREELYELTPFDIDPTLNIERAKSVIDEIAEKGRTISNTINVTKSGEIIPVEISSMFFDMEGEKVILSIARDITERIKHEKSLRESEERYRSLIQMLPYAVFIRNEEKVLFVNKKGLELFDACTEEEVVNKRIKELFDPHPDYVNKLNDNLEFLSRNGYLPLSEEKFIRLKDKKILDFESVVQKYNYKGEEAVLIVAKDISKRKENEQLHKKMEEQTRQLNEVVEYEKLRTEFFANISHELRTPIHVILSTLQLCDLKMNSVINSEESETLKKHITIMKQNCYRLIRLINNLIDVTKIDSGYFQLNLNNYNIVGIVEEITLSVAEYIENKGISLIFDTDVEEKILACDPDKIERIMLNLISNAVKFTEPGGSIIVTMSDKGKSISISVKDSGIGIPKDKQKYIFERFIQVDKSLTRTREGSGIGLSLVKSLVEMHKGTITVNSKYGKGSEFIMDIPVVVLESSKSSLNKNRRNLQGNIEKINVEFSDIYF